VWQHVTSPFALSIKIPFSLDHVFPSQFFFFGLREPIRLKSFQSASRILLVSFCVLLHAYGPLACVVVQVLSASKPIPTLFYILLLLFFSVPKVPILLSICDALLQDASTLLIPYEPLIIQDGVSLLLNVTKLFWPRYVSVCVPFGVHIPSFAQYLCVIWL